jgi:AcrR family transcriptional regulator
MGLRRRKREVVREALAAAARHLFLVNGYEETTVERIAQAAGVSRRTFFRYFESKENVVGNGAERLAELVSAALAARPRSEHPLVAIRHAVVLAVETALRDPEMVHCTIRLLRGTGSVRQVVLARLGDLEGRVTAVMRRRVGGRGTYDTPVLLGFLTRALLDAAFNAWHAHETEDVAKLVDDLIERLRDVVSSAPRPRLGLVEAGRLRGRVRSR